MKAKVGETAGNIWRLLKEQEEVNISQLPKLLNEKSSIVYQGLGWLAREDKIEYRIKTAKTFVSLSDEEMRKQ